jgi:hypothetical protein
VTAGLGVPTTLTWNGRSKTAPEIPAGVATTAMANAAARATTSVQPVPSTRQTYPGGGVRPPRVAHCGAPPPGVRGSRVLGLLIRPRNGGDGLAADGGHGPGGLQEPALDPELPG